MRPPIKPPEPQIWLMSDGYAVHGRVWPATTRAPTHAVIYLHGIQSHGGWFEWSASLLAERGTPVLLPDRRGSGLNHAARGDTPSAQRWLLDIDELAAWAERQYGVARFDVVGVSWGGKPAVAWALRHPERVARLLLIAPGLFPAVDVNPHTRWQIGLSLLVGGKRTFGIPLDDPGLFTDNPAGQQFIADDPLKLTRATARFFWHSRHLERRLLRAHDKVLQADTTLVLAEHDQIIRNQPTGMWLRRLAAREIRTLTVDNAAHTLEFAAEPAPLRDLLGRWVSNWPQPAQ